MHKYNGINGEVQGKPAKRSVDEIISKRITHTTEIPEIIPIIRIGKENPSIFSAEGDISFITGQAKSGKSTVAAIIMALLLMKPEQKVGFDSLGIFAEYAKGRPIVYFDTEQSIQSTGKLERSIRRFAGLEETPENLYIIPLANYTRAERMEIIKTLMDSEILSDTFLWFIDGVADLVGDVNNPNETNEVLDYFRMKANTLQTGIILFLHENPGSGKMRGHLGSDAERKCAGTITIKKDREKHIHSIESRLSRHSGDFDPIYFRYDKEQERMVSLSESEFVKNTEARNEVKIRELQYLAEICVPERMPIGYQYLANRISEKTGRADRTAKNKIKEMVDLGILQKVGEKYAFPKDAESVKSTIEEIPF